jgi:hypothetical protein
MHIGSEAAANGRCNELPLSMHPPSKAACDPKWTTHHCMEDAGNRLSAHFTSDRTLGRAHDMDNTPYIAQTNYAMADYDA